MSEWWTVAELRKRIDRCEADCEAMIARGEPPEKLRARRQGIGELYKCLERAERDERMAEHEMALADGD